MKVFSRRIFESAVVWTLLSTFLRVGASVFVLPLVLRQLPAEHLGMWYVFGSLAGFAALLDLGFETTISRMTSYVWAGASRLTAFGFHDPGSEAETSHEPNRALFCDLLATLRAYYLALGSAVLLLMSLGGGAWIWSKTAHLPDAATVRWAWLVYSLGTTLNFVGGRWPALLGGIDQIRIAQQVSVVGLIFYYAIAVAGLTLGYGLWALVAAMFTMGVVARSLGRVVFSRLAELPGGVPAPRFHPEIFAAIWPNAWRTGLVSLGAFLIVQANTLVCSAVLGLTATASYGISFQLASMLAGVSAVWVQVKLPQINQLRLRGEVEEISHLFARRIRWTIVFFLVGALGIVFIGPAVLHLLGSRTPLLPLGPLAVLLVIQFLEVHHSQYAHLVLTENRNPFLKPALLSGLAVVALSVWLTPHLGVWGLLIAAGGVQACFNNWWTVLRGIRGLEIPPGRFFAEVFLLRRSRTPA